MENFNGTALTAGIISLAIGLFILRRSVKSIKEGGTYNWKIFLADMVFFDIGGSQKSLLVPIILILFGLGGVAAAFLQNH